ncbi:hypothetical protein ABZ093_15070 [Streptomyces cyaneofuscatus]|uniref:hypothetical protein n=1 Tax=Streptomyces cyaneofuscatus TaxID=66883 RepID=UPI0033A62C3A
MDISDLRYSGRTEADLQAADGLVCPGNLLFTRYNGNAELVGACTAVPESAPLLTYPDKLIRAKIDQRLALPEYVAYAFSWEQTRIRLRKHLKTTAGQVGISGSGIKKVKFPLPSLEEQRSIVVALEEQFSRLDAALTVIAKAKADAVMLLQAIWDDAASGRIADGWPGISRSTADEPLTNGWKWRMPADLTDGLKGSITIGPFGSNLKVSDYKDDGVPLVFVRNIRSASFSSTRHISREKAEELKAHSVKYGDLLVTKMGEPPGDAAAYKESQSAIITADCIRLRPAEQWNVDYLVVAVNSTLVGRQIESVTRGVAQRKVSLGRFRKEVRIPTAPVPLQDRVMEAVNERVDKVSRLQEALVGAERRAEALRRSLLTEAFAGRLVSQVPSEEPVDALLTRIRAEHEAAAATKAERRSPSRAAAQRKRKTVALADTPPAPPSTSGLAPAVATQPTLDLEFPS